MKVVESKTLYKSLICMPTKLVISGYLIQRHEVEAFTPYIQEKINICF